MSFNYYIIFFIYKISRERFIFNSCNGENFVLKEFNYKTLLPTDSTTISFNNPNLIKYVDYTVISNSLLIIGFIK